MSQLLPAIDFVAPSGHIPKPGRHPVSPHVPSGLSTSSQAAVDAPLFSSSSVREPLAVEDGGLKDGRIFAIIAVLTGVQFLSSLSNGFLTVGLPRMASDLSLPEHLLLWPSGVY
jgi:hypothetical protein